MQFAKRRKREKQRKLEETVVRLVKCYVIDADLSKSRLNSRRRLIE